MCQSWDDLAQSRGGRGHRAGPRQHWGGEGSVACQRVDRASCRADCVADGPLRRVGDERRACRGVRGAARGVVCGGDRAIGRRGQ